MSADPKKTALIAWLFAKHRGRLRTFLGKRVRRQQDVEELVQEVYVRMLGVRDIENVQNPEGYLYTVAANLAKEHALRERVAQQPVDVDDPSVQERLAEVPAFGTHIDAQARIKRLREVLRELPPKCHAAVVMANWYGMSYEAIAERLDVSPHMVKKYLSQALMHCRRRMGRLG
jgi:RNA polymerase sigma-70 factor (ECF subfamily)